MLERIKYSLAYIEWLLLIGFVTTYGILIHSEMLIGAITMYLFALILFIIMIRFSSKKYLSSHHIVNTKPMTSPIIAIIGVICCFQVLSEPSRNWQPLIYFTLPIFILDLIRWYLIVKYDKDKNK